jgi:hypothetical protein
MKRWKNQPYGGVGDMTPASAVLDPPITAASDDTIVDKPTREEVIAAISQEVMDAGVFCDKERAAEVYDMLARAVESTRRGKTYYLTTDDMVHCHGPLDVFMADDVTDPPEGSAHALTIAHFIEPGEQVVVHSRTGADRCILTRKVMRS